MNLVWIWIFCIFLTINCVRIVENGYKDVTISFSGRIRQESFNIEKLKKILTRASEILYHATRRRSYFEEFTLVIPSKWTPATGVCDKSVAAPKNIDIYVTDSSDVTDLKTQHSKGCGQKGDVIYLPDHWLTNDAEDLAFEFVHQWSTFRYGVFSENPERPESCIATSDSTWNPTGCYNVDLDVDVRFDNNGLPKCNFPESFQEQDLRSSIMFRSNSSKAQDFCDGTDIFPHNPIAPTLHNRICEGNSAWSVIRNTEDFQYGRNLPLKDEKPPNGPTFSCFKETKMHLALIVQDSDSEARNEIRYSLLHFFSIIEQVDFSVTFATFSNNSLTKETESAELILLDKDAVKSFLDSHLKLNQKVSDVCLVCGLQKAYEVSATSQYPMRVIILLAWESSLENVKASELVDVMETDPNATLHLLFLQDTADDIVPPSLVEAVQNGGGRIFRVKNEAVFMLSELNVALLDASRNVLHIEDKIQVVHQKSYVNVKAGFTDAFLTPKQINGQLIYSMQCKKRGDIRSSTNACTDKDDRLQSPVCGMESNISADKDSEKLWQFPFIYDGSREGTTCSSLALLKLGSTPRRPFTVKGWLSENEITPGRNVPIVYAEIFSSLEQNIEVAAKILGPGSEEFWLNLHDNGNGDPDITKGDNIYSHYFTSFTQKGTYTVSINVGVLVANKNKIYTEGNSEKSLKSINQTKVIGTFWVTQTRPAEDIFPPNRVSDLRVVAINNINRTILLEWTAPGDDYDNGKAKKYIMKLSNHWTNLMDFTFNLKENVLLKTEGHEPLNSGLLENITISLSNNFLSNNNATYYIALQTIDDRGNKGRISNIIQIHFKEIYLPPEDDTETSKDITDNSTTSVSTEVSMDNFTSSDENPTTTSKQVTNDGIFIEKNTFIIVISTVGAFILILIIIIIIVCCCCSKKEQSDKPSQKDSLRPPYDINIGYKRGSETSLDEENGISNSLNETVNSNNIYSSSEERSGDGNRYTYHTNSSLRNKRKRLDNKNDLGFKIVEPMPAYATSSLSRFTAQHRDRDNERDISNTRSNTIQLQNVTNNADSTRVYPLALEYKLYYTDDWRNLQEALLYKIPSSNLNATQIKPKRSGYEEHEEFQLYNSSLPIIYYIALKAIDKNRNKGKLSNIVQVQIMFEETPWGNETENITKISDYLDQDEKPNKIYWYIIIACVFGIILILTIINILVWAFCFRKYKRNHKASRLKDVHESKHHRTGNDMNSDESILQGECEDGNKYQQSTELMQHQDIASENTDRNNPLIIYAKVDKITTNKKPAYLASPNTQIHKIQQTVNHKECDLGFV